MLYKIFENLDFEIKDNQYDFFNFPDQDESSFIETFKEEKASKFTSLFIIGFGASSFNARTLICSVERPSVKVFYIDSLDRISLEDKLVSVDIKTAGFFVLSKSGNTDETFILTKILVEDFKIPKNNLYIICPPGKNLLAEFAVKNEIETIVHPSQSSGRFSIISLPSLLVAAFAGVNHEKIIESARGYLDDIASKKETIVERAYFYLDNYSAGRNIYATFNYSKRLEGLCLWQKQMWAESLGKEGFGATPVLAEGTLDQHSSLQLYLDGPDDKFYRIMGEDSKKTVLDAMLYEHRQAVIKALKEKKRPIIQENYLYIDEETVAQKIVETLLEVTLLGKAKQINPFDQPGVEKCKGNLNNR